MPPIKQSQVIDKSVEKAFIDLNDAIAMTLKHLDQLLADGKEVQTTFANAKGIKSYTDALTKLDDVKEESNKTTIEQIKLLEQKEKLDQQVEKTIQLKKKGEIAETKEKERLIKAQERQLKQQAKLTSSYSKMSKELNETRAAAKNLAVDIIKATDKFGEQSKEVKALQKEYDKFAGKTNKLDTQLKDIDANLGQFNRKVGNYKSEIKDALSEQEFFGTSLSGITAMFTSVTGVIAGVSGAIYGLAKAYTSSARGANDLARASDRLDSIMNDLGNSIADLSGGDGFLDKSLAALQSHFLGIASAVKSNIVVGIKEALRELEVLEVDQERQKKAQLDRAEVLRQIRDEERNSFEERKAANDELGQIINTRETESITFQEKRLAKYQLLLNMDKDNLELQKAIKQVEFEIADIREEAQGYRSEQLINDLALSRELNTNQVELTKERIREELIAVEEGSKEEYDLNKRLLEETFSLEIEAAGKNAELRAIVRQKYVNDLKELEKAYKDSIDARLEMERVFYEKSQEALETSIKKEEDSLDKLNDELDKLNDEEIDSYLDKEIKKTEILKEQEAKRQEIRQEFNEQLKESAIEIGNALFDIQSEKLTAESERIAEEYDTRLAREKLDEEARSLIEAQRTAEENRIAKEQRDLEKKQFLFNQGVALAEVGIDTSRAVIASVAASPLTFGQPWASFALGTGAIQAAAIIAQSIPAFDKGTKSLPGLSEVAEKRPEFVKTSRGVELFTSPTILGNDYTGAEVISGAETARILDNVSRSEINELSSKGGNPIENALFISALKQTSKDQGDRIVKAINNSRPKKDNSSYRTMAIRDKFRNKA